MTQVCRLDGFLPTYDAAGNHTGLPNALPDSVNKTVIGPGENLQVTLRWQGGPVQGDYRVLLRLIAPGPTGGLILYEDLHYPEEAGGPPFSSWGGETSYTRTITLPADNFYTGPAFVTVALVDSQGRPYALSGEEEYGRGQWVVLKGLTVQGSVPENDRAAGDLLGGRLVTSWSEPSGRIVSTDVLLYQNNEEVLYTEYAPVTIKSFRFTTSSTKTPRFWAHPFNRKTDLAGQPF